MFTAFFVAFSFQNMYNRVKTGEIVGKHLGRHYYKHYSTSFAILLQWAKARKDDSAKQINDKLNELAISVKKIELQTMIYNRPKEISVIFSIFDEYKKLGGDSWADDLFLQWRAKYVKE